MTDKPRHPQSGKFVPADAGQRQGRNQADLPESNSKQVFQEVQAAYRKETYDATGVTDSMGGDAA